MEILAADEAFGARGPAEPNSLEAFLSAPKYYRGYLTASDLERGLTGASALREPQVWTEPLRAVLGQEAISYNDGSGSRAGSLSSVLLSATAETSVVVGPSTSGPAPALPGEIRDHNPVIRKILDGGALLLRAEPAHDGVDWALYSATPLAGRFRVAFEAAASQAAEPHAAEPHAAESHDTRPPSAAASDTGAPETVVKFVIPQREARGEHKFYFERYDLDLFAAYRV